MASAAPTKLYADDVSLVVVLIDTNPFFWTASGKNSSSLSFADFISHVLPFLNSILLLNQLNQVVLIATGVNSCEYIYDSSLPHQQPADGKMPAFYSEILTKLEEFASKDQRLAKNDSSLKMSSLLSGSLSLALCYIQKIFRAGPLHPQPRVFESKLLLPVEFSSLHERGKILCLQGSPDGPEQYVAIMNAIFSAQRSMVPIDSCVLGTQNSAFLQQASHITGGIYQKPAYPDGLFQYLSAVFATDLQSRSFLRLPKPPGVDFRASCFCHKKTIDMGYICSVCLSIFCKHHKKCSTCGSDFNQSQQDASSTLDHKRKTPEA